MSGGYFNYTDEHARNEIFNYFYPEDGQRLPNVFGDMEISELVWDVFELIHDYDYFMSGDTSEDTYLPKKMAFKRKWFGEGARKDRIQRIVDSAIEATRGELYKTFGLGVEE